MSEKLYTANNSIVRAYNYFTKKENALVNKIHHMFLILKSFLLQYAMDKIK